MAENLGILGSWLPGSGLGTDHRDGTYVRALFHPEDEPEIVTEDKTKVVASLSFPLVYRIERGF
jgi:hypothetical protein